MVRGEGGEEVDNSDRAFWMLVRQALLLQVDAIERRLEINPRTARLRKDYKCDIMRGDDETESGLPG